MVANGWRTRLPVCLSQARTSGHMLSVEVPRCDFHPRVQVQKYDCIQIWSANRTPVSRFMPSKLKGGYLGNETAHLITHQQRFLAG